MDLRTLIDASKLFKDNQIQNETESSKDKEKMYDKVKRYFGEEKLRRILLASTLDYVI
jgi:chromosome condensin MukBEF MukE localization factor